MNDLKGYILAVVGMAICCGIVKKLVISKGPAASLVSAVCGIAVTIVVISPVVSVKIPQLDAYTASVQADATKYVQEGKELSRTKLEAIILEQTCTYILDKAASLGCDIEVSLQLSDDLPPTPAHVTLDGQFTPYAKALLSQRIESELGIPKEMQKWNYQN